MAAPMSSPSAGVKMFNLLLWSSKKTAILRLGSNSVNRCRYASTDRPRKSSNRSIPEHVEQWKKLDWRAFAKGTNRIPVANDEKFAALLIPGHSPLPQMLDRRTKADRPPRRKKPPRFMSMPTDQDWTNVWPAAETFKWSVVPFPVRQGYIKRLQNDGIPPGKYANVELMKIPNFLHLTPAHVKKHCAAIKKFCTDWPEGLNSDKACDQHFPIEVCTRDYVTDSPNLRDPRARLVTLKVKLSTLDLDEHARDKLQKLVGDRYDKKTDVLTLEADRCPVRKQNYEYLTYLLTVLYHESWKTEAWESEQKEDDMLIFEWDITSAKTALVSTLRDIKQAAEKHGITDIPQPVQALPSEPTDQDVESLEAAQQYKEALCQIHSQGEDSHSQETYKQATKKLLLGIS